MSTKSIKNTMTHRYRLERSISSEGKLVIAFIGINPSTADEYEDDNTVKNLKVFAAKNNANRMIIGNVYALRSMDVKGLSVSNDPIGVHNDKALLSIIEEADLIVPFWGSRNKLKVALRARLDEVMSILLTSGKPISVLGLTSTNDPRHSQGVSYKRNLISLSQPS